MSLYPNVNEVAPSAPELEAKVYPAPYPPPPPYSQEPMQQGAAPPMPQPQVAPATTTTTTTVVVLDRLPSKSVSLKCYYCNEDIKTKTQAKANCCTWLLCSLLCIFGCFCGCCLIPFCTRGSRDILHYCPKCHKYLGVCERFRFGR